MFSEFARSMTLFMRWHNYIHHHNPIGLSIEPHSNLVGQRMLATVSLCKERWGETIIIIYHVMNKASTKKKELECLRSERRRYLISLKCEHVLKVFIEISIRSLLNPDTMYIRACLDPCSKQYTA